MWEYAAHTAADATARIRSCTATGNPAAAADAASAASDALHVAAAALGSRTLCRAADDYDRAARQPYGRVPAPTPAGNQLRHAARLISAYAYLTGDRTLTPVVLLVRLAALAEAVAELRQSQQRATQAAAALRAAGHLRTATRPPGRPAAPATPPAPKPSRPRPATAAGLAQLSFPSPPPAPPARTRPARPWPAPAATATSATAAAATGTHPMTSTKTSGCSAGLSRSSDSLTAASPETHRAPLPPRSRLAPGALARRHRRPRCGRCQDAESWQGRSLHS